MLYSMSIYECLNSSSIAAAGDETFHGGLKSYLARDETVILCISTLVRLIPDDITCFILVE